MQIVAAAQGATTTKYLYYTPKGAVRIVSRFDWGEVARTHPKRVEEDYLWLLALARATGLEPIGEEVRE